MRELKQSTAATVMVFITDSADHVTGKTGLTLTITASKAGGAFASISPVVTERGTGWYSVALTAAHTDTLGDLALHITASGADPADVLSRVIAFDPQDAVRLGLSALPNATAGGAGGVPLIGSAPLTYLTGDAFVRLGAPAGASIAADIAANAVTEAAIKTKTDYLPSAAAGANGGLPLIGSAPLTYLTGDAFVRLGVPTGASIAADIGTNNLAIGTLLGRLGAFTGTGVNTVKGFFQALFRKDATLPTDVGGTFDPATDSIEAIRDHGDIAWITATGFAVPGSAMTLTAAYDAAKNAMQAGSYVGPNFVVENGETVQDVLRLIRAACVGINTTFPDMSTWPGSIDYRSADGTKARITATVTKDGQRTAIVTDPT